MIGALAAVATLGGCGGGEASDRANAFADEATAEVDRLLADAESMLNDLGDRAALRFVNPEDVHGHPQTGRAQTARQERIDRLRERFVARCNEAVTEANEAEPAYRTIGRGSAEALGAVDCVSRPDGPAQIGDEVYFLRAYGASGRDDSFSVGDYSFDGESHEQFLPMGIAIESGVLFAELRLSTLWRPLSEIERGEGTDIVIIDENGTIIARPALPYWVGRSLKGRDELVDAMLERDSGTGTFSVEDRERLYAFRAPESAGGSIRVAAGVVR